VLLFDIVTFNDTTRNVVYAVYYPAKQLAAAGLLGLIVIFTFTTIEFFFLQDEFDGLECKTMMKCLSTTLNHGLRNGGGIGDFMIPIASAPSTLTGREVTRWLVDFSFFLLVIIVLLNIIFGIIIDTFSDLRSQKEAREADERNNCFICGISKSRFDSDYPKGFAYHQQSEHNLWDYVAFMVYLWEKNSSDYSGLEEYVFNKIRDRDVTWLPINKALAFESFEDDTDDPIEAGIARLHAHSGNTRKRVDQISEQNEHLRAQVSEMQTTITLMGEEMEKSNAMLNKLVSTISAVHMQFSNFTSKQEATAARREEKAKRERRKNKPKNQVTTLMGHASGGGNPGPTSSSGNKKAPHI